MISLESESKTGRIALKESSLRREG